MAIPWAGIGSALSGAGALAGALGIGGSKGPSLGKQNEYALNYLYRAPRLQSLGAKKAGLHPLFAMGASPNVPSYMAGQSQNQFADALDAAGQVAAGVGQRKQRKLLDAAALKESEARAYKATAEGVLADQQAGFINQQANAAAAAKANQNQTSARDKIYRSHVPVRDHYTGKIKYVPNPEIYELPETVGAYELGRGAFEVSRDRVTPPPQSDYRLAP